MIPIYISCDSENCRGASGIHFPAKRGQTISIGNLSEYWVTYALKGLAVFAAAIALAACGGIKNSGTPPVGSFTASSTDVQFGSATIETPVTLNLSLANSSATSVVVSQVAATGASFSVNGLATFPLTVAAGGTATFNVQFDASAAGAVTGQVTIASNSPSSPAIIIQLSGTGVAAGTPPAGVAGLTVSQSTVAFGSVPVGTPSKQSVTLTSSGTESVIVSADGLTGTGFTASGITLPLTITAGQTATLNLQFDPTAAGAATSNLTITSDAAANPSMVIALNGTGTAVTAPSAVTAGLAVNSSTVAFGTVGVGVPSTQVLTLTSSGTGPVVVSADSLTGTGFTASGITLPLTIASGQAATLNLQFDPTTAGAATSSLSITSNATASPTTVVALSGTGVPMQTDLAWDAPAAEAHPVTGYNIYRASGSSSTYAKLNSAVNGPISFADSTILAGATYDYYVTSVDSSGNESVPSNTTTVVVP